MKKTEILGLITMVYDYDPKFKDHGIESSNPLLMVVHEVFKFLQRKKYFTIEGRPTKKTYKLLDMYDVKIEKLEQCRNADQDKIQEIEVENKTEK